MGEPAPPLLPFRRRFFNQKSEKSQCKPEGGARGCEFNAPRNNKDRIHVPSYDDDLRIQVHSQNGDQYGADTAHDRSPNVVTEATHREGFERPAVNAPQMNPAASPPTYRSSKLVRAKSQKNLRNGDQRSTCSARPPTENA